MVIVAGNRILGGIGAPGGGMSESFGLGANTAINQRVARQGLREREQKMAWDAEDRARTAAAFEGFGAGAAPTPAPSLGGMFTTPQPAAGGAGIAPPGFSLGSPGQITMPRPAGAPELTFGLLRQFEGFRETPYWDVNAYRTGYGSDTVTLADGRVVPVQPGMTISRADAERDLMRRVQTEFAPRAASQVGAEIWGALPEHVRAPLISLAYNYGSLPDSVVAAVRTGDPERIAAAIEARATDNDGINAGRRRQEAAIIRSGGAIDLGLMRAAAAPVGEAGMSSIPTAAPVSAPAPAPVAGLRFGPDGSIILPTATEAMAARPGDFAARATAEQLAMGQRVAAGEYNPNVPMTGIVAGQMERVRRAQERFNRDPSAENMQAYVEAKAELDQMQAELAQQQVGTEMATRPTYTDRGMLALEGPEAVTLPPRPAAGVTVPPAMETPAATTPAPAEPAPVETVPVETAPVEMPAPAPAPAPTGPSAAQLAFDPLAGQVPLAGVAGPTMTTMDVSRGANVNTISDDFPGIGVLFTDTAALAIEQQALEASAAALVRQRELARQLRDATLMLDADSKLAAVNARRGVIGYIAAGNAAATGNFDPMAQALSEMSGQQVQIVPRGDNTFDLIVDGQVARQGLPADVMVQQYMYGVNDQYRTLVDQARAAEAERNAAWFDAQVEILKETLKQEAQGTREMALEAAKRSLDQTLGATPEFYTEKATLNGEEVIVVYDRKNPNTPVRIIGMRENPLVPGTFELVQRNLPDVR